MTTIGLVANDQLLQVTVGPKISSGEVNTVIIHVDFSEEWNDFGKNAVFYTSYNSRDIYEIVMTNDECIVPSEVMSKAGTLYIGIRGVNSDKNEVKTTSLVKLKISEGAPTGNSTEVEPTPNVYQQLLTAYGKTESAIENEQKERMEEIAIERARIDNLPDYSEVIASVNQINQNTENIQNINYSIDNVNENLNFINNDFKHLVSGVKDICTKDDKVTIAPNTLIGVDETPLTISKDVSGHYKYAVEIKGITNGSFITWLGFLTDNITEDGYYEFPHVVTSSQVTFWFRGENKSSTDTIEIIPHAIPWVESGKLSVYMDKYNELDERITNIDGGATKTEIKICDGVYITRFNRIVTMYSTANVVVETLKSCIIPESYRPTQNIQSSANGRDANYVNSSTYIVLGTNGSISTGSVKFVNFNVTWII